MKQYTAQAVGRAGEKAAAKFLKRRGYRILARNKHLGKNELDIVAADRQNILFVEVKARAFDSADAVPDTRPSAAVDVGKRQRTARAAFDYLHTHPTDKAPRLDVVEVYLDRSHKLRPYFINHIENAFSAHGAKRA